ncbi:MAG: hypothetical protein ACYTGP_11235 [Planctomycetota bacterium]|jgi:hypothetical protein
MVQRLHILVGALVLAVLLRSHGGIEMPCFAEDDGVGHVHRHVHVHDGHVHVLLHQHQHDGHVCGGHGTTAETYDVPCIGNAHDCDGHRHPAPPNLVILPRSRSDWSPSTPTTVVTLPAEVTTAPIASLAPDSTRHARCLGPPGAWAGLHGRGTLLLI